jgi:hypothetical protein
MRDIVCLDLLLEVFEDLISLVCDLLYSSETFFYLACVLADSRLFLFVVSLRPDVKVQEAL